MSFFSNWFGPRATAPPSSSRPARHNRKGSSQLSNSIAGSGKWERQREDEETYGAPSPRPGDSLLFTSHPVSPVTSAPSLQPPHSPSLYPPSRRSPRGGPYFRETLSSPLGMGGGNPIIDPRAPGSAPPLKYTWSRIGRILETVPEMGETLAGPADPNSLRSLETTLAARELKLPRAVKDHFSVHDGQDAFAAPAEALFSSGSSGLVWGLWMMSVDEVQAEWGFWRRLDGGAMPGDAFAARDFVDARNMRQRLSSIGEDEPVSSGSGEQQQPNYLEAEPGMGSCPANWVHAVYSHHGWVPLLTDRVGNYIGVDLDPPRSSALAPLIPEVDAPIGGGQGQARPAAGQVIAFGREIDEKVVLWRGDGVDGWGKWLASFADDLEDASFGDLAGLRHRGVNGHGRGRAASLGGNEASESSSEEEDEQEDGLGEMGYFNDGEVDRKGGRKGWRLKGDYKGMSPVHALCARSKRHWAEIGLRSSFDQVVTPAPASQHEEQEQPLHSPHLVPKEDPIAPAVEAEVEATPLQDPLTEGASATVEDPTTPVAVITPPSPKLRASAVALGKQPQDHHQLSLGQAKPQPRRAGGPAGGRPRGPPPPAPMAIGLPTMEDLLNGLATPTDEEHGPLSATQFTDPVRRSSEASVGSLVATSPSRMSVPRLSNIPLIGPRFSSEGRRSRSRDPETGEEGAIGMGDLGGGSSSSSSKKATVAETDLVEVLATVEGSEAIPRVSSPVPLTSSAMETMVSGPTTPGLSTEIQGQPQRRMSSISNSTNGEFVDAQMELSVAVDGAAALADA